MIRGDSGERRGSDRAQTIQDFAVGASVFLLTVSFVFAFVPSLFTPFTSSVDPGAPMQADRVSDQIINDTQIDERPNYLRVTGGSYSLTDLFTDDSDGLQDRYRLPSTSQINVTLSQVDGDGSPVDLSPGGPTAATGNQYNNRPAASLTRIVGVPGVTPCDPAQGNTCRLTVRIW
jgi:hypothetical protein